MDFEFRYWKNCLCPSNGLDGAWLWTQAKPVLDLMTHGKMKSLSEFGHFWTEIFLPVVKTSKKSPKTKVLLF
jgi:hypothetical protein